MVFFEEKRAMDISLDEVIDALYIFFPDIEKRDIKFFYHGTYNVFDIKDRFIFRIPDKVFRNINGIRLIQNEVKMLNHIQKYVSVRIPEPMFISTDPVCPLMGYEKIKGMPLSRCFHKSSKNQKVEIAQSIGGFLSQLHSDVLIGDAIRNNLVNSMFTSDIYHKEWVKYFEKVKITIFKYMSSIQKKWISDLFNSFLNNKNNFDFKLVIVHGDFDITNILVDPKTFKLTGIVDFEESRIYDPAVDFTFFDQGNLFLKELLSSYQRKIDNGFKERMKFLYGRASLAYIEFGTENNIPDLVEAGFQLLKKRMTVFDTLSDFLL